jgi:hypothetical protein
VKYLPDSSGGVYELSYLPLVSGVYTLSVSVAGEEVGNGPFLPLIVPAQTDAGACEVTNGLSANVANRTSFFTVVARDAFGNRVSRGGDDFVVQLVGADDPFRPNSGSDIHVDAVVDQGNGTYVGSFNPPASGPYHLHVALALGAATNAAPVVGVGLVAGKGGLLGDYSAHHWRNAPLVSVPIHELVAKVTSGPEPTKWAVGSTGPSVRWGGYVKPEHSGKCTFYASANIISLRVGGVLLIDARSDGLGQAAPEPCTLNSVAESCGYAGSLVMRRGMLYDVVAEWGDRNTLGNMELKWGSLKGSGKADVKIAGTFGVVHASRTVRTAIDVSSMLMPGDPVRISCQQRDVRGCENGYFETRVLSVDGTSSTIFLIEEFPGRTSAIASLFRRARKSNIPHTQLFFGSSPINASPFVLEVMDSVA